MIAVLLATSVLGFATTHPAMIQEREPMVCFFNERSTGDPDAIEALAKRMGCQGGDVLVVTNSAVPMLVVATYCDLHNRVVTYPDGFVGTYTGVRRLWRPSQ